jgi:hypothetical protein
MLFVFACILGFSVTCQTRVQVNPADSLMIWEKLNVEIDPKINDLLLQQTVLGKKCGTAEGYRLQIYFGSGEKAHEQAVKIKTDFLTSNPDVLAYLLFKSPDFIVRVGNFRTKSEALKLQKALVFQYPNSFIVADEIAFPVLSNNTTSN